ncbi:DUF6252 family protein [Flavobacterium poyangense]|uniref:DUF6252 family protein n=1 Tax=Flavobacterium poyangense TaxID=2204302 RepID=UPI0014233D43|nr:DUF6252 family protein [Flavobacterium sp. JXAS1]
MKNLKRIILFAIAVLALVLSSFSCSDEKEEEIVNAKEFIKFKYNEKSHSYEPELLSSLNINLMGSEGRDDTYKKVSLWLPLNPTVGSHPVVYNLKEMETTYQATFSYNSEFNNANAKSGTITITKVNADEIEGTFTFSGTQNDKTFTVTEGSFKVER